MVDEEDTNGKGGAMRIESERAGAMAHLERQALVY
jgi:hypothetical protein